MVNKYWNQKAATWVSAAVLAGGMATAVLLFFLVRLEAELQNLAPSEIASLEVESGQ